MSLSSRMDTALPLDSMTLAEKLRAMEALWDDLCRTPDEIESPAWHEKILADRKARVNAGKATFSDWPEAKRRIRKRVRG